MQAACGAMGAKHGRLKMNPELLRELLVGYLLLQSNSLRRGRNQIPVSNVYELTPISSFWAPNVLNELQETREFPFNLIGKSGDDGFSNGQIMVRTQILVHK